MKPLLTGALAVVVVRKTLACLGLTLMSISDVRDLGNILRSLWWSTSRLRYRAFTWYLCCEGILVVSLVIIRRKQCKSRHVY